MPVNLKELAARLGLSPTTVSRALGGYSDVSPATRVRVEQATRELGYQPNRAARQIARGKADAIGIVYPLGSEYLGNPAFLEMLGGLAERVEQDGVDLLLAAAPQQNELATYARMVHGRRVDAMIVAHTQVEDPRIDYLLRERMPFLAYGRTAHPEGYAWFDFDNEAGGRMTVQQLTRLGHRRIGYVHSPLTLNFARQRHDGFVAGLRKARLRLVPEAVVPGGLERRTGYAAGQYLLGLAEPPTAIVVDSSLGGIGVIRALLDAGVAVGSAISVLVYEGVPPDTLLSGLDVAAIMQPTPRDSGHAMGDMVLALTYLHGHRDAQKDGPAPPAPQMLRQPVFVAGNSIGPRA
jgi:LacI family transcriptional regulator